MPLTLLVKYIQMLSLGLARNWLIGLDIYWNCGCSLVFFYVSKALYIFDSVSLYSHLDQSTNLRD